MEKRELTCIGCPMGCAITVEMENGEVKKITGNTCNIGYEYAKNEVVAPKRIVTTTVRLKGGSYPVISVKTSGTIPKEKIFDVIQYLKDVEVNAPIAIGEAVVHDICGTGVDIIVTGGSQE